MASDLLNLGAQSVLTAQRQLSTTGHNISNVNTEGYSRQSVIQGTNTPRQYGGETYGMGVHVEKVRRSWDQFAVNELNLSTTSFSFKRDDEENLDMLSKLLSSVASKKIPENLNEWFDAIKTLADSPNDVGARKVVLEKADLITQNMNDFHENIRRQSDATNKGLDVAVERINQLALELRDLQRLMMRTPGPHNDLMDQHEKLVAELSEYTKVTVTPRKNAEGFNIHIGSGHTLVSGTEASQMKMVDGYPDVSQRRLAMIEGKGIKTITTEDIGGKLSALFTMRDKHIPYLMDELGRMATSFSYEVNKLQSQGLDLRGNVGRALFTDVNSEVNARSRAIIAGNSKADMAVYIEDTSALKSGEYSLQYNGSNYTVLKPTGERVNVPVVGSSLFLDGMRVEIRNAPQAGERILLRPTRNGAAIMKMATNDPTAIAAQSYEASTTFAQGQAKFNILSAGGLREFEVVISPTGDQFAVTDTKGNVLLEPQAYPPSNSITVLGTTFELTAGALPNDKFTANLVPSEGDNGNLRKMQQIQTEKKLNDGETTVLGVYHDLNTDFGLQLATASRLSDVARLEKESAQERIASISGVNLDEEAANMMKFQQAYMASSRIMQVANDTFNTILQLR
ncbi:MULTISPECIES: flagellar hook-associated protein FlgK [unclassified Vibrio]|uniref:flagellar hook-associated protein FlgK n=1 Tax=unclassified Vibrio TaxID=2614977 RepID=UPI00148229AC|nr:MULTISPECIES: flagellar hook-associated protein FlgK [unclassified Vibrio]MDQ2191448.1 flagellar hook-associated protein FlgK [Vibrio sp. A14(2019)]MDQ2197169.1 flagellar hook-associated protein FlgK [Vibrio sp. 2017_1457_11]NNN76469.1 flagellar hook-associated protein FlgK [Vibrio sp. B7]NNN92933.1 flagellar hook-associated protein FlgK [Vibrio sp. B8-1]NNO08559.1 flagellar hook-associated protein FlgK [Vibrio sp. B4-12]